MVYYECQRCGYNTTLKGNIKHHLNRKNVCEPILSDISIYDMKNIYDLNLNKKNPNESILNPNESILNPKMTHLCAHIVIKYLVEIGIYQGI